MNVEYIKDKIFHLDDCEKIQFGERIPAEVINILRQGNMTDRSACFVLPGRYNKNPPLYESEITCSICDAPITRSLPKTQLLNYLNGDKEILCDVCEAAKEKSKQDKLATQLLEQQNSREQIQNNTDDYIAKYLDPNQKWDDGISPREKMSLIMYGLVNYSKITSYIKRMNYHDFLQTPYWVAISAYKKYKTHYKCALCGSNKKLVTHHKSYERHGQEHLKKVIDEDLIVLCDDCHNKFHDKLPSTP